jgi:hypothetical protein
MKMEGVVQLPSPSTLDTPVTPCVAAQATGDGGVCTDMSAALTTCPSVHSATPCPVESPPPPPPPATATGLSDLCVDVLLHIATFASAQDVYALLRTCRALWWLDEADKRALLRRALDAGLRVALASVARPTGAPGRGDLYRAGGSHAITAADIFPHGPDVDNEGRPQVLLAGSTTVRAVLSSDFRCDDVDIFTTWAAAPAVRRRLIENCELISVGNVDTRTYTYTYPEPFDHAASSGGCDSSSASQPRSRLAHVESFSPRPRTQAQVDLIYTDPHTMTPDAMYEAAVQTGERVRDLGATRGLRSAPDTLLGEAGVEEGDESLPIPYAESLAPYRTVHLIIAAPWVLDARVLLATSDLTISQTSFDGHIFRIADPARTLCGQTTRIGLRKTAVDQFIATVMVGPSSKHTARARARLPPTADALQRAMQSIKLSVWRGLGYPPPTTRASAVNWNVLMKLIARAQKYSQRGIELLDTPPKILQYDCVLQQ